MSRLAVIEEGTENANIVLRLLPDEVVVGDFDDGLAKGEVHSAVQLANTAVNLVKSGARDGLDSRELI